MTHYIFSGTEGSSACDVYQFSVAAVNSAGSSDQSEGSSYSLPTCMLSLNGVVITNIQLLNYMVCVSVHSTEHHWQYSKHEP